MDKDLDYKVEIISTPHKSRYMTVGASIWNIIAKSENTSKKKKKKKIRL